MAPGVLQRRFFIRHVHGMRMNYVFLIYVAKFVGEKKKDFSFSERHFAVSNSTDIITAHSFEEYWHVIAFLYLNWENMCTSFRYVMAIDNVAFLICVKVSYSRLIVLYSFEYKYCINKISCRSFFFFFINLFLLLFKHLFCSYLFPSTRILLIFTCQK